VTLPPETFSRRHRRAAVFPFSFAAAFGVLAALVATAAGASAQVAQQLPGATVASVDSVVMEAVQARRVVGVSVAIAVGDEIVHARGYGYANVETGTPATPETVYRIGSITKPFTAIALMRQVEAGRVSLESPITRYLDGYPETGSRVTVRHLLNHTSGIPTYTGMARYRDRRRLDIGHDDVLAMFSDAPLNFEPGSRYAYNNSGYYLLGVLLEHVTGETYAAHLQRTIFEPLRLAGTSYCLPQPVIRNRAAGYAIAGGVVRNAEFNSMTMPFAAGALCSTAAELVRWHRALLRGELVRPETLAAMTRPGRLNDGSAIGYGYGYQLGRGPLGPRIGHGGSIEGFNSMLAHYPEPDVTIVVLTNTQGGGAGALEAAIAGLVQRAGLRAR
jgi:D-alanyl-D-alanine carboxypeptidase